MVALKTLNPRNSKIAIKILLLLSGSPLSDCCDILDVVCSYLNAVNVEGENLNEIIFDLTKFIKPD